MSTSTTIRPEPQQLHYKILNYLTMQSRILFAYSLSGWDDFVTYNYQYADYSREELREEFLITILPKVFTYNLTPIQRRKVEIFAHRYFFSRDEEGFRERKLLQHRPTEGVDYVISVEDTKAACVISHCEPAYDMTYPDETIASWASAINSEDSELAHNCVHRGTRLRNRVAQVRKHFQQTGELPENMNPAIVNKIISFRNKAKKLSSKLKVSVKK